MDREVNLPPEFLRDSDSSSSSSSSAPDFLRDVQAAFKRHRTLGTMQSNKIMPKRACAPKREALRGSASTLSCTTETKKSNNLVSFDQLDTIRGTILETKNVSAGDGEAQEDVSLTTPSLPGTVTKTYNENSNLFDVQRNRSKPIASCKYDDPISLPSLGSQLDGQKKVQFSVGNNAVSLGADDRMATGMENLSSHMGSIALTDMEWDASNQVEASTIVNQDTKCTKVQNVEDISLRPVGGISLSSNKTAAVQDQLHQFRNFLSQPIAQSTVAGSSCATTTSIHSTSAPMLNPSTYCSRSHQERSSLMPAEPSGGCNAQPECQGDILQSTYPTVKDNNGTIANQTAVAAQASSSLAHMHMGVQAFNPSQEQGSNVAKESDVVKHSSSNDDGLGKGKGFAGDVTDPLSRRTSSEVKLETCRPEKQERVVSGKGAPPHRKRNYDPELFFKVNGKLYQRLGKIGSGGSSEVHKVISSDCTIYALKKIKLKGRDYATAFGFCQEIEYLNKLKGKNHIIQLIDYEVTDKTLLQAVMSGSMGNKDGKVRDDGCIYMVLEYGEIDLAHMLSQKWKEVNSSNQSIDENWLRFYWQQILQAVNTIHEERIVHSDLKPANFLLVKGSLKLIDFGIAKAIMSDTTNIQRDSQVGTLSYMSPEAFMCNEDDANGNTIKCGRPSDIWSLGCILYQMVYGRTPFAEYKTFWAKFKVITDPNHQIVYEPVSNPWLLNLMKKCLAWDRNERWRIPQLLQHPFIVPPVPSSVSASQDQSCKLLHHIAEACATDPQASMLYHQLVHLLNGPDVPPTTPIASRNRPCDLLSQMSKLCTQIQERLTNPEEE